MKRSAALLWLCAFLLVGCGGDGGGDGVIGTGDMPIIVAGAAQKGPYVLGSEVLLNELLPGGTPSSNTILTEISDDLGTFKFSVTKAGAVLMTADGYHFNEITGKLSQGRLLLKAVYDVTPDTQQHAFINILTHLAYKRTLTLIAQGMTVTDAINQAEMDVVNVFRPVLPVSALTDFTRLNVFDLDTSLSNGNAYVLALSATIYQYVMTKQRQNPDTTVDAELTYFLNNIADDIADNGAISNAQIIVDLVSATRLLRPDLIKQYLENRSFDVSGEKLPVANMDLFIDTDGDGLLNVDDPDDDNDGIPDESDASPYVYSEAPVLLKPDVTQTLPSKQEIVFEWTSSEYAINYEIQISKNENFSDPIISTTLTTKTYSTTLDTGVYYFRIRAQNDRNFFGEWGKTQQLAVGVFTKSYAGTGIEYGARIVQTKDGGFAILGSTFNQQTQTRADVLVKLDNIGKLSWRRTFDNDNSSGGTSLIQTVDEGFLLSSEFWNGTHHSSRIIKTDSDGYENWTITKPSLEIRTILEETDGFLFGGSTLVAFRSDGKPNTAAYLLKIDAKGNELWSYIFSEQDVDFETVQNVSRLNEGGYSVIGSYFPSHPVVSWDFRPFFTKLSSDRSAMTYTTLGSNSVMAATVGSLLLDGGNMVIVTANLAISPAAHRFDANGKRLWSFVPMEGLRPIGHSPVIESYKEITFAGDYYDHDSASTRIITYTLDENGTPVRSNIFRGSGSSYYLGDMIATMDGGIAVLGTRGNDYEPTYSDFVVFKTNATGEGVNISTPIPAMSVD